MERIFKVKEITGKTFKLSPVKRFEFAVVSLGDSHFGLKIREWGISLAVGKNGSYQAALDADFTEQLLLLWRNVVEWDDSRLNENELEAKRNLVKDWRYQKIEEKVDSAAKPAKVGVKQIKKTKKKK